MALDERGCIGGDITLLEIGSPDSIRSHKPKNHRHDLDGPFRNSPSPLDAYRENAFHKPPERKRGKINIPSIRLFTRNFFLLSLEKFSPVPPMEIARMGGAEKNREAGGSFISPLSRHPFPSGI